MNKKKSFAYIARCSCGGMVMATTNDNPKDAAKHIAKCIKDGFKIETMSIEDVRKQEFCKNHGNCIKEESL
jgi:hypothetical protein